MNAFPTPRDGELLSAYLAGDLDAAEASRLEARLQHEPELAARLETTRAVVEGLAALDDVEPPNGFSERLQARLAEERQAPAGDAPPSVEAPVSLAEVRAERTEWLRRRWPALGAVAAGIVGVALFTAAVVGFGTEGGIPVAGPFADDADVEVFDAPDEDVAEAPMEAADEPAAEQRLAMDEPLVLDTQVALDDADRTRDYLDGSPAEALLGLGVQEAEDLAAGFTVAVRRAEPFASGAEPGACMDTIVSGTEQPVVPAHVESVRYEGDDALLYVTATARAGADVLDRVEAWVLEPADCAARLYVELTPSG